MIAEAVSKRNFWAFIYLFLIIPSKDIQVLEACWMHVTAALKAKVVVVNWSDQIVCSGPLPRSQWAARGHSSIMQTLHISSNLSNTES